MKTTDILPKLNRKNIHNLDQELAEISENSQHQKKNGEIIQIELKRNKINFKGKESEIVVVNDVTKIRDYIKAIEQQNTKLQEIAWMQSHIVRAPLARMMAVIDLIKEESLTEIEKQELMSNLLISASELDKIIRDISNKTHEAKVTYQ